MTREGTINPQVDRTTQLRVRAALLFALAAMTFQCGRVLAESVLAVRFPWNLDYGEGIVWEQLRLIVAGKGYGPIDQFPAIVFHYPPVYHLVTAAASALSGLDPLAAGRSISLGSTILMGLFAGLIAAITVRANSSRQVATTCGLLAGLTAFSFSPIVTWVPLMRVDMLSIAFSLAGVLTAMAALKRPMLILGSSLLFTAAIYTKQVSIVAPASVFLTFLLIRPRLAWGLAAGCMALGLAVLTSLQLLTEGGFVRHIFLYNVNRFEASRLIAIPGTILTHILFAAVLFVGISARLKARWPHYRGAQSVAALRKRFVASPGDAYFLLILMYALFAGLMSLTIIKSGSNVNYFIEAAAVFAILIGIVARDSADAAIGAGRAYTKRLWSHPLFIPLLLGVQVSMIATSAYNHNRSTERAAEFAALRSTVATAARPVISDDMVLLIRSGLSVQWEPAIFAELARTGAWNETPFIERIKARQFAFFITQGSPGDHLFDSRYNPAIVEAMQEAYPVRRTVAGLTLHFPADQR